MLGLVCSDPITVLEQIIGCDGDLYWQHPSVDRTDVVIADRHVVHARGVWRGEPDDGIRMWSTSA